MSASYTNGLHFSIPFLICILTPLNGILIHSSNQATTVCTKVCKGEVSLDVRLAVINSVIVYRTLSLHRETFYIGFPKDHSSQIFKYSHISYI